MSFLEQITGMSGAQDSRMGQYQAILSWVSEQGGIEGVLGKFREQGLGAIVESWLSSGASLPVTASQIVSVLGSPAVSALAQKLGIDTLATSSLVAESLPKIVDILSPGGRVDTQQDLLSAGMTLLKNKLFS
jgi:Uncharacterized protein conserved in bacteria